MARRSTRLRHSDPVPAVIERHMLGLGFQDSRLYLRWCRDNGFRTGFNKNRTEMREEREAFEAIEDSRTRQARLHKHPMAFLEAVCMGQVTSREIDRPNFHRAALEIEASDAAPRKRRSLLDMLRTVTRIDDMVFHTAVGRDDLPFVRGLIRLHDRKALWLRPLEDWKPKSKNRDRRFGDLAHHLFDRYGDVPAFMDSAWLRNDRGSWRFREWYVHLGRGNNLRTARSPVDITKKVAHHFLTAPETYTPEQAVRWGQMKALGAGEAAIHAVAATRLGQSFDHEDFWVTVLRFIADNPMLDPRQIGPIIDYLHSQRFEPADVEVAPGEWRREPPPQPRLSMSGRTAATLMHQVAAWHESLRHFQFATGGAVYAAAPFAGLEVERQRDGRVQRWTIRQLRTGRDLQLEGAELRHCVASYHWSCANGLCTIWDLAVAEDGGRHQRRQTIEVNQDGVIVQCRGRANRDPGAAEWAIVTDWARQRGLRIAAYL